MHTCCSENNNKVISKKRHVNDDLFGGTGIIPNDLYSLAIGLDHDTYHYYYHCTKYIVTLSKIASRIYLIYILRSYIDFKLQFSFLMLLIPHRTRLCCRRNQ